MRPSGCHPLHEASRSKTDGDLTAFHGGHVTLNPIPHMRREPFGMLLVPIQPPEVRVVSARLLSDESDRGLSKTDHAQFVGCTGMPCLKRSLILCTFIRSSRGLPSSARKLASYPSRSSPIFRPGKIV